MSQHTVRKKPRKHKKWRAYILKDWIVEHYPPCRVADIAGGKGLLSFLLQKEGWTVTVIDPEKTLLLDKYKDLKTKKNVPLTAADWAGVPWREEKFEVPMAADFDLLISLHGHGVQMKILEAAAKYQKKFAILPCCVIDEPIGKQPNVYWENTLVDYGKQLGLEIKTDTLDFVGKNIVLYN
ncbi:MAG: hypothetical protein A2542_03790 [Parcubacteria group bacterium RIFOXYD2_FULL_52_8]|nr:MAG: hypothetical protein A2542_03790 [Parcubacteria group bacterium RIFOXYD2_FULL_52_8]